MLDLMLEQYMVYAGGALLLVGVAMLVYLGFKTGWKLPTSFEEAKQHGALAAIAFVCTIGGFVLLVSFAQSGESPKDRRARERREEERAEEEAAREEMRKKAAIERERARQAGEDASEINREADKQLADANTHGDAAADAGTRAETALEKANRLRDEREGRS